MDCEPTDPRVLAVDVQNGLEAQMADCVPGAKTLEEFDFDAQRSVKRELVAHLGQLDFVAERANVVFLGPPGPG